MICIQKIYGLNCLNHKITKKSCDVNPRTNGERKMEKSDPGGTGVPDGSGGQVGPSGPSSPGSPGCSCALDVI